VLTYPGFHAVVLYRLGSASLRAGLYPLARLLYYLNVILFGADLHPRARIGPGLAIPHPVGLGIGAGARIGRNALILKGVTLGTAGFDEPGVPDGFPTVGDNCRLMDGAKLFGPIEVGANAQIGANALVVRSVPAGAVVISGAGRARVQVSEGAASDAP
jgi:serine O-acetyltransferase